MRKNVQKSIFTNGQLLIESYVEEKKLDVHVVATICLQKWGTRPFPLQSLPSLSSFPLLVFPVFSFLSKGPTAKSSYGSGSTVSSQTGSVGTRSPNALWCILRWNSCLWWHKNQHSTTNWQYKLYSTSDTDEVWRTGFLPCRPCCMELATG